MKLDRWMDELGWENEISWSKKGMKSDWSMDEVGWENGLS